MPEIHHLITIGAAPATIYPLVATGAGFKRWWAEDVIEAGGAVEVGFFNRATVYRLVPEVLDPATRAVWRCDTGKEWSGTRIVFEVVPRPPHAVLRFSHADWREPTDYFVSCNTTWGVLMFRLKAVAEGGSPGPLFSTAGLAY